MNNAAQKEYTGSPAEIGAQLYIDALGPTIEEAMKQSLTPNNVVAMLAGIIGGVAGQICSFVGPDAAMDILRGTAENIEKNRAAFEPHKIN